MSTPLQTLAKLQAADMAVVRQRVDLPTEAAVVLQGAQTAPEALDRLQQDGMLLEATRLVAHALPRREAVWWACMCAAHTAPPELAEPDRRARELAEDWVRRQTDEIRRAGMAQARRAGFQTPEAWAAAAAFWSGDSMTELDQVKVPPPPHLTGLAVAGGVALAAVRGDAKRQPARLAQFLASAREIAGGGPGRLAPEAATAMPAKGDV